MKISHKSRRFVAPHPQVASLIADILATSTEALPAYLSDINVWKWPRSDLNAWIKVLNKLDAVLEEIIREYELDHLQTKEFSPQVKETLTQILKFERLLLENSTNRKMFNSYDRLNSLFFTSDLDVLVASLLLLLRPSQQYSAQPAISHSLHISSSRLESLAKTWTSVREHGIDLVDLVSEKGKEKLHSLPQEASEVYYTFYGRADDGNAHEKSNAEASASSPSKALRPHGPTPSAHNIHLGPLAFSGRPTMDILSDAIKSHHVPDNEKYELMCRIRTARALDPNRDVERQKLVIARLLAIAVYAHTHPESQAQTTLLLYDSDLVNHIAELLQLDHNIPVLVQTAAIAALDAFARYRSKIQEVLAAVNAGVNHGILMSLLRKTVSDISHPDSKLPHMFVEALLSFIIYIASHSTGGNMVVGAGLVPLLIQIVGVNLPQRLAAVSKTMQLMDNILYGFPNAVGIFCNNHGVETLTDRIKYEVDLAIEDHGSDKLASYSGGTYGLLQFSRAGALKHLLRSMHRLMQSSGTTEGMRGLIDSSLLKSVEKIIKYRGIFGPNVLPIAINIVATFVHNEPTSLATIQEAKLPETIYATIEAGLEPAIEVIQAIPNALGALCLNSTGQMQLVARPSIVPTLFTIFTSERHVRILQDKDNAALIGSAIDELIRHHPALKMVVFDSLISTLRKIIDLGNAYVPPDDIKEWYILSSVVVSESEDVNMTGVETTDSAPLQTLESSTTPRAVPTAAEEVMDEDGQQKSHDNVIVSFIDVIGRFMEGLFQHVPHCKDFVEQTDGLNCLARLNALPCLPYDFASSVPTDSLIQVTRTLTEVSPIETLSNLTKQVKESLQETSEFWEVPGESSRLLSFVDIKDEADVLKANSLFRRLVTLHIRLSLMADVYSAVGYTHNRGASGLLQNLSSSGTIDILQRLGSLHRKCIWENIVLRNGLTSMGVHVNPSGSATPADAQLLAQPPMENGDISSLEIDQILSPSSIPKDVSQKSDTPLQSNATALRHVASRIPNALGPFFQATARMLIFGKRIPEPSLKQTITFLSKTLSEIMFQHLQSIDESANDNGNAYAYYTVMLGLVTVILFDERSSQSSHHTLLLVTFCHDGGIKALLGICQKFTSAISRISDIKPAERSENDKQEMVRVFGGLKMALHLLYSLVSFKPSSDPTQIVKSVWGDKPEKHPDYYEPHDLLVRLRLAIAPAIAEIWRSNWLASAPPAVTKYVIQTVHEIIGGENEKPINETRLDVLPQPPVSSLFRTLVPDEDRIQQLVDMGFPREAAERALARSRNNISVATEYLLAHPFLANETPDDGGDSDSNGDDGANDGEGDQSSSSNEEHNETEAGPSMDADIPAPPLEFAVPLIDEQLTDKTAEERRHELDEIRASLTADIGPLSLRLVDAHPTLIFDVRQTFIGSDTNYQMDAIRSIIQDIERFSPAAYDVQEDPLSIRCHLLALVLVDSPQPVLQVSNKDGEKGLMDILLALLLSHPVGADKDQPLPKWLAALMLALECLLVTADAPRAITLPVADEPIEPKDLRAGPAYTECKQILFDLCIRLLGLPHVPRDELLAILRLLVHLTRDQSMATAFVRKDGLSLLLGRLKSPSDELSASGLQAHITIILRHLAEDRAILESVMKQEIKRWLGPRNRSMDVLSFVRNQQAGAMAARDPQVFVDTAKALCKLSQVDSPLIQISLKVAEEDITEKEQGTESQPQLKEDRMQVDSQANIGLSASSDTPVSESLEAMMHFLLSELIRVGKSACERSSESGEAPAPPIAEAKKDAIHVDDSRVMETSTPQEGGSEVALASKETRTDDHAYACFLMQCLMELMSSYEQCKLVFLHYPRKRSHQTPGKDNSSRSKSMALNFLLQELVSFGAFDVEPKFDARKRIMLCNWAMSTIVALCVDSQGETRSPQTDLTMVRKTVLEAISKSFKDGPSTDSTDVRYGRLLALADLCHKLLTTRFNTGPSKLSEVSAMEIAKIMLEKNFVATLTNVLSEVDLNYPNMHSLVGAILRPLEYLTKVAIKMGRASEKSKEVQGRESVSSTTEGSDDDEDDEDMGHDTGREETPDLYRNSSLGMFGGEMDDAHFDEDDAMGEDEEDDEEGDIEYDEETASEDTSNTDEDIDVEDAVDIVEGEIPEDWQDEDEDMDGDEDDIDGEETDEELQRDGEVGDDEEILWGDVEPAEDGPDGIVEDGDEDELDDDHLRDEDEQDEDEEPEMFSLPEFVNGLGALDAVGHGLDEDDPHGFMTIPRMHVRSRLLLPDGDGASREGDLDMQAFGRTRPSGLAVDNLTHPLLVENGTAQGVTAGLSRAAHRRSQRGGVITGGAYNEILQTIQEVVGEGAAQIVQQLVSRAGPHGANIHVEVPSLLASTDRLARHARTGMTAVRVRDARPGETRSDVENFVPLSTLKRWTEEAKIIHGKHWIDRVGRLNNHLILAMLPEAREAQKKAKEKEERERKEQETADAAALAELEAAISATTAQNVATTTSTEAPIELLQPTLSIEESHPNSTTEISEDHRETEGVSSVPVEVGPDIQIADVDAEMVDIAVPSVLETQQPEVDQQMDESSLPGPSSMTHVEESVATRADANDDTEQASTSVPTVERIMVTIHGNPVDITDTGIDPTFLEALPDDMREEVLNQHFRERRSAQIEQPVESQISPEFLEALPPEIRAEILQQERMDRARQDRQQQSVVNPAEPTLATGPTEMDAASFIASLDPLLRQTVLMDSDDGFLQTLPPHMIAEVGSYRDGPRLTHHIRQDAIADRPNGPQSVRKTPHTRDAVQLLEKHAVATLVRLLFFPHLSKKNSLHKILLNLCENSKSRTDLFNLLLGILQDGTGDLATVDKSFSQLSVKSSKATPLPSKGKQKEFASNLPHVPSDIPPDLVAQRCLDALTFIVGSNELSSLFFLTEHELPAGMKKSSSKKGKGKEKLAPQSYYPIVLLLNLLDRQTLLKTPSIMDSVAGLLDAVTRPLLSLKGSQEKKEVIGEASSSTAITQPAQPSSGSALPAVADPTAVTDSPSIPAPSAPIANDETNKAQSIESMEEKILVANPPQIPHPSLRLIVNILTIGDCSGRTFQHTLALIQHLSFLPDARDVIAQELKTKAQEFGNNLSSDLDVLVKALETSSPQEELPSTLTAKFSPASSDQAKLLRVLKTIDYMFSKTTSSTTLPQLPDLPDEDSIRTIYESLSFTTLWNKLGDCLTVVENKTDVEHVATILLPLIESLMVVCKNVGLKSNIPRPAVTPSSPGAPMVLGDSVNDLFVSFTDNHRKVLNLMVRNNPSLMSGSFSLLVQNPRVLDFDNKRNYFSQQLHRRPHPREHYGTVQLNIRRARVFEDSYHAFLHKTGDQIKYGKLSVRFYGEEGVDAGGVTREWFQILARQMFDPNYALFEPCAADSQTYQPNRNSAINPDHLSYFKFVGRVIGKAIYDGRLMDAHFARSLYRQLLGKPVDYRDVEWVDPEYYKSLCWILENDPTVLDLTFITEVDAFGEHAIIPLKENGASIAVTVDNRKEYVQLSAQYRLFSSIKNQIENLLAGFYEIIPKDLISIFNEQEVELLISGTPDIDVDEWRAATEYNGYTSSDPVIVWWWRALKSFNRDERAKVLSFATGTSRVPLGGFVDLQGVQGVQRFSIHKAYGDPDRLPQAHTCFNQIDLPQYSSYEKLRHQLLLAISEGGEGFGFA